ncbi:MAG: DUF2809 domain-containing protein [Leptolyngbyaceae cyanobacterium bins.59]|nr:DUF2809 domain-containing protein [Leptolyngbyaceae cyanobacterium bins.59]
MSSSPSPQVWKYRLTLLLSLLILIPLGYFVRFYGGGTHWLSDFLGSVAYEIFWILLVLLIWPQASVSGVAIGVFLATCLIEFLQLWQLPILQALRSTFLGRLILGNVFSWKDFLSYFLGSIAGWFWGQSLHHRYSIKFYRN